VLFESLAAVAGRHAVGVLLSGMGDDGAVGLLAMRRAGATTIVQDAGTAAVDGMPRAARELGAASLVLPLPKIAGAVRAALEAPAA
jgi:chemotaxis response regulator CheB